MASDKAHMRFCLLCELEKGNTATAVCRSIFYEKNADDCNAYR